MSRLYRKCKHIEKTVQEVPSNFWDIFMRVTGEQRLNQIIHILKANSHWAFVWTRRLRTENSNVLYGYIIFPMRCTRDWFRAI
jgi:hypothetical protein